MELYRTFTLGLTPKIQLYQCHLYVSKQIKCGILCGLDHICDSIFETAVNLGRICLPKRIVFFFLSGPKHITVASVNHLSVYGKCTSVLIWKEMGGEIKYR